MKVFLRKLKEKQIKIADRFNKEINARKMKKSCEEMPLKKELVFFKVFSMLKSNFLRKKAKESVIERFYLMRRRKNIRKLFSVWLEKCGKLKKKTPNLYNIDLGKYQIQTPKFQMPGFAKNSMKEEENENSKSYGYWLKEYEENEKFMHELSGDNK